MKTLPRRVFNSPLIEYANFNDGTHINLIRLTKPYANGNAYAIANWTEDGKHGLYKTLERAQEKFEEMVSSASFKTKLKDKGTSSHTRTNSKIIKP